MSSFPWFLLAIHPKPPQRANAEAQAAKQRESPFTMNLPTLKCRGLCHQSCGPIIISNAEFATLREAVGERVQGEPAGEHHTMISNFNRETLTCPLLTAQRRCAAYESRPMICRLWGMMKKMRCPFGCRPSRWLDDREATALLKIH